MVGLNSERHMAACLANVLAAHSSRWHRRSCAGSAITATVAVWNSDVSRTGRRRSLPSSGDATRSTMSRAGFALAMRASW